MNQVQLLKLGEETLKQNNIEEAEIKAKKLLEFILNQTREKFIINSLNEVSNSKVQEYQEKLKEILQGKPLQYITHNQEFMGLNFYVDENVLIPQPDTEILVEQSIKLIENIEIEKLNDIKNCEKQKEYTIQILDLCTGSGAIAISIAKHMPNIINHRDAGSNNFNAASNNNKKIQIIASDISNNALEVAKKNAMQNQIENIQFIKSDMFLNLKKYKFDLIVSNPPYIETSIIQTLSKEVQQEPALALDGGEDGLDFYRIILNEAHDYLKNNGYLIFEIGYNQFQKIKELWKNLRDTKKYKLALITKKPIKDLGGNDRIMIFKKQAI